MLFTGDPMTVRRIWVIPWDTRRRLYGVAYEFADGESGCGLVGSEAEAKAVVEGFERHVKSVIGDNGVGNIDVAGKFHNG